MTLSSQPISTQTLQQDTIPSHVGIIMDGNGRWAKAHGLPVFEGHRRGVEAVRATVRAASKIGVKVLTLYSFSAENWSRPPREVSDLMMLLKWFIKSDVETLHEAGVKIRIIGARAGLPDDILALLTFAETRTAANTKMTLVVAFNYGARQEILSAVQKIAGAVAAGTLAPERIELATIDAALDTCGLPDPDVIIRTSGEQRLSNFLLWQAAYAELVFLPVLWPDFDEAQFVEAISLYQQRKRRFGGREEGSAVGTEETIVSLSCPA